MVDAAAMESVASQLLPIAADLRDAGSQLVRHAPDPGTPPAADALVEVQGGAVDALEAVAAALEESSALLIQTVRRYRSTEEEVARAIGRVGQART